MAELKGTKTEKNLMDAFAGESQARNRYTFYAQRASKEGDEKTASLFEELANNEREHARLWFKLLSGGDVPDTDANLRAAAAGEHEEWTEMYKRMAAQAREEGFNSIALLFENVGGIEKEHEERFLALINDRVKEPGMADAAGNEKQVWICKTCGYIVDSDNAPQECPVCGQPQDDFALRTIVY